jgi:hypothetical protein
MKGGAMRGRQANRPTRAFARSGLGLAFLCAAGFALAERVSDISNTRHNLSVSGPGAVKATGETQICVFCHTPHGADTSIPAPLWNRKLSGATYTPYTSSSLDAEKILGRILDQPAGSSKLCLSCHDGTLAIGAVNVLNGQPNVAVPVAGTGVGGTMPPGAGTQTGFTRNLGVDLTNDHPISFTYDSRLALADGELRDPATATHIAVRRPGVHPAVPLEPTGPAGAGQVQCATCHDPHIHDSDVTKNIKFLRLNRFQEAAPAGGAFSAATDIVCLGCHDKLGQAWAGSAHADPTAANELYSTNGATLREFPLNLPVWQAACLNCHDTHTVHGARRLAREGTDSLGSPKSGGNSAIEETCYQCHSLGGTTGANPALQNQGGAGFEVPNIQTDFLLPRHMPIVSADQPAGREVHDITNADFIEPTVLLGKGNLNNRHAECTDCHNPHRVMKNRLFNGTGPSVAGTHAHASGHTNIASGVLRGAWGVEPVFFTASFLSLPSSYLVKQGDGGTGAATGVGSAHVTREYQICLKCHSDFGYDDNAIYPIGTRPNLGSSGGGTPSGTNNLAQFTNQAMEFQAPAAHKGEITTVDSGAGSGFTLNNHRSWHPVIDDTGRSAAIRNMSPSPNLFLDPWNGLNIGAQTMYCSDCHGSNTAPGTAQPPGGENGNPWGPHGSTNDFILKGQWDKTTGQNPSGICFKCHNYTNYATQQNEGNRAGFESGFGGEKDTNLHAFHAKQVKKPLQCMWCHVAVPHGWKNKAFLVNLNDAGPEAGLAPNTEIPIGADAAVFNQGPYYSNAKLKVRTFAPSGRWEADNCGSASGQPAVGKDWMEKVCSNPP